MDLNCTKCEKTIFDGESLSCAICGKVYHFLCAGVQEQTFRKMRSTVRATFKGQCCISDKFVVSPSIELPAINLGATTIASPRGTQPSPTTGPLGESTMLYDLIRMELLAVKTEVLAKLEEYKSLCEDLTNKNAELERSVKFCSDQHHVLLSKVTEVEEKCKQEEKERFALKELVDEQAATIRDMKTQLNISEQKVRVNNIEIFGVPERRSESLSETVIEIARTAGVTVTRNDMEFITRVAPKITTGRPKPIIVKFVRQSLKDEILRAVRKRKGVTTQDIGIPGDKRQIYLNDHLTPANKNLYSLTRAAGKEQGFRYTWTSYTKIYARKNDGVPSIRIRNEADLIKLKQHNA